MSSGETPLTVVGNAVQDPELRFTPSGAAVASFRVASTPRAYNSQTNQWEDGEALFLTVNVWRQQAENIAETISKGMRVVVTGRLKQRSYQTKEGENRVSYEVEADEVAPSLKFASAVVNRNPREGGNAPYSGGMGGHQPAQQSPTGGFGGQANNDPWGKSPAGQPVEDAPPF